jgi:hypothetical protein
MENSIIMKLTSFYLEANDWSNRHMYEFFKQRFVSCMFHVFNVVPKIQDLTSNTKNVIFFFNTWQCYVVFKERH